MWSVDPQDWHYRDEDRVSNYVTGHVRNGSIIICHDIRPTTIDAIDHMVDLLQKEGYEFKTVSELSRQQPLKNEVAKAR